MKVIIIEDEYYTAEYLKTIIRQVDSSIMVVRILSSVEESINYFENNREPDLIFSDIQLTDGQSFDIFKQIHIRVPIIFTTAYDQYALEAFKANGIDYILKPFMVKDVKEAIDKYQSILESVFNKVLNYSEFSSSAVNPGKSEEKKSSSLLIKFRDNIMPVKFSDIGYFTIVNKALYVRLIDGRLYTISKTIDEIQNLCSDDFFRVNRQTLINKNAISKVMQTNTRKLILSLNIEHSPSLSINKNKASEFLTWLRR